jgi:hypothetical protein
MYAEVISAMGRAAVLTIDALSVLRPSSSRHRSWNRADPMR